MDRNIQEQVVQFNRIFKRYDDIYRRAARKFNLPELSLWILYVLRENSECTQKDLVDQLLQSKQSIHSALKTLIQDRYVELEYQDNNHRSKYIRLTEKGSALAEGTADKIVEAEHKAFLCLADEDRVMLLNLLGRLTSLMDAEMERI